MLSSFINAAICSQRSLPAAVAFTLAHRLADVNEEDELTTMFCMFTDALAGVRNSTLADLLAVRMRVGSRVPDLRSATGAMYSHRTRTQGSPCPGRVPHHRHY